MSKVSNSVHNIIWGILFKIVTIVLPFASRTVIIHTFGMDYVGINSLFSSILQILSLTELGIGTAILYSMYKPVACNDNEKVCALLNFYRKIYRGIGLAILAIGIICLFNIETFISGEATVDVNIKWVFLAYLMNTAVSYFLFSYTTVLFTAHMRDDLLYRANVIILIAKEILQVAAVLILRNYYAYVIILPISTVIYNLVSYRLSKKTYPHLCCKGDISAEEKKTFRKQVAGLLLGKISVASRNSMDSVIVSSVLGLAHTGRYSNYYYIMYSVFGVINYISAGVRAAIGQNMATKTVKENYNEMMTLSFGYYCIYSVCTAVMLCVFQPFMFFWVGKENMYDFSTVLLMCFYFFLLANVSIVSLYWEAAGLFWENGWRYIAEAVVNLGISCVLISIIGINGVIIGTLVAMLVLTNLVGVGIVFKHYFAGCSIKKYYLTQGAYLLVTAVSCGLAWLCCEMITLSGLGGVILKALVAAIITIAVTIAAFCKTRLFQNTKRMALAFVAKRKKV